MPRRRSRLALAPLLGLALAACPTPAPRPAKAPAKAPPLPLQPAEIQASVTGAARLHRHCRQREAPTGLYVIRLLIEPSGRVSQAELRRAPPRAEDPAIYAGVPRYIGPGPRPENPVTRCLADALGQLRLRRFGGPTVGFDYPVVVEHKPPDEPQSPERACAADSECVFRPPPRCSCPPCPCPRCVEGPTWRRALSRATLEAWRERWNKDARRCRRKRRRARRRTRGKACEPCPAAGRLGTRALCIDGQCAVR